MNESKVTIIVPTFNRAHYLSECVDSLLAQTVPAYEIIVIDDGSEDDTANVVLGYGDKIRYVRKENGGKPKAVNLGLSMARGDLIWIFDDDDVALPDAIETRLEALRSDPKAGFVYSPHYYGSNGTDGRIVQGKLHQLPPHDAERFFLNLMQGCFFHLATALVPAQAYHEIGGFDEELLSSEDYDIQLKLARKYPATFSPTPCFVFRQHTGIRGAKAIRYSGTERKAIFRRFDQKVGLKLRSSLELGEYLTPRKLGNLTADEQHQAILNRMLIMASKGCIAEWFEDLETALIALDQDHPLSKVDKEIIASSICTGYAFDACGTDLQYFLARVDKMVNYPQGRVATRALALGMYRMAKGWPGSLRERIARSSHAVHVLLRSIT